MFFFAVLIVSCCFDSKFSLNFPYNYGVAFLFTWVKVLSRILGLGGGGGGGGGAPPFPPLDRTHVGQNRSSTSQKPLGHLIYNPNVSTPTCIVHAVKKDLQS